MVYESSMGVMSPASGRETPTILARGSSSNTRADSGSRNDADDAAAASPSGSGGILKYLRPPSSSASSSPVIDSPAGFYTGCSVSKCGSRKERLRGAARRSMAGRCTAAARRRGKEGEKKLVLCVPLPNLGWFCLFLSPFSIEILPDLILVLGWGMVWMAQQAVGS